MTSPINNINRSTADSVGSSASRTREKSQATATNPPAAQNESARPASADTVSLSAESMQVGELRQQLNSIPEVDAEKVAAIKEEIAKGNYPLDAESIAENLLNLEKALSE